MSLADTIARARERLDTPEGRLYLAAFAALAVVLLAFWYGLSEYSEVKRTTEAKERAYRRFVTLEREYLQKRPALEVLRRRARAGTESVVTTVEEISAAVGVRDRLASIKPADERTSAGYALSSAEVTLESLDLVEAVNFLYRLENHRSLLKTGEFTLASRFDDPELYDLTLEVTRIASLGIQ